MNAVNTAYQIYFRRLLSAWVVALGISSLYAAPTTNAVASATPLLGTNGIPLSVFDVNSPAGKDPFFPRSGRRFSEVSGAAESDAATALMLQGFSGTINRRLAIINNKTFAAGDEGEVITSAGRIRIRCVEIKNDTVVVTTGTSGQRIDLRLPSR